MENKGFTLVELLATLVILSIIMLVAVPSTLSVLDKNKKESFVSDAKRLVALAESQIRNNDSINISSNEVMIFTFNALDDGSFEKDADSTDYISNQSYVAVFRNTDFNADGTIQNYQYEYYVQLIGSKRGIILSNYKILDRGVVTTSLADIPTDINSQITSVILSSAGKTVTNIKNFNS